MIWGRRLVLNLMCVPLCCFHATASSAQVPPAPADPLTASMHIEDAERFARLYLATYGKPSPEQIQKNYLDGASYGVTVFTPYRIQNAAHLAEAVSQNAATYDHAIHDCLPRLKQYDADLRSIYLAMHGLYPDQALPQIYVVFGANNSGGTAGPNVQVLGLEVICKVSGDAPEGLRTTLRHFFAHETTNTFQNEPSGSKTSPLLASILTEGAADFVSLVVTGTTPEPQRAEWATHHEAELWNQLQQDLLATQPPGAEASPKAAAEARHRWVENYDFASKGWPGEVGYWEGMRIWQCYYDASIDKHQAMQDVIRWNDPDLILRKSGYSGGTCSR